MKKIFLLSVVMLIGLAVFSQKSPLWLRYPAISPDGKVIVFTYKGAIYKVAAKGGKAVAMTNNTAIDYKPVWSPDGKFIAYASNRHGNFDIYIVGATGGTPKRLTFNSANEIPTSFTADGKDILFTAHIQDLASNAAFPKSYLSELYSVSSSGGRIKQILSTPAKEAKYSKDGSKLIYQHCISL